MRDPSIHIKESVLIKILEELFPGKGPIKWDCKKLAKQILTKGRPYRLSSRSITITNDKLLKKTDKLKLAGASDTAAFAQTLLLIRRQLKHKGLTLIQPGEPEWFNIKEACKLATEFCNEFQIPNKTGYKEYIKIGMSMMKNFSVFKFKGLHSAICNRYEAIQKINQDPTPSKTQEAHDNYIAIISEKVGFAQGYNDNPEKYQYFIEVKNEAAKFKISTKSYIKSQFNGFDWRSGIPDPMQLVGIKAVERLQRWAFENNQMLGKNSKSGIDFKKIKR